MSVNKVTLVGVVTNIRALDDKFYLIVMTESRAKDTIKREFHNVLVVPPLAQFVYDHITREDKVYLEAQIQYEEEFKAKLLARKIEVL